MSNENEELVIVLQLKEGIGFNKGCDRVFFQASIGSHKLDHEPRKASHTTLFNCNLVWETDRASIKSIKLENIPIKIDIFGMRSSNNNIGGGGGSEHIGYILLPIRSVPVLPLSKAIQAKCRWYKLIGLSTEWRAHRPEIHLNAMITSSTFLTYEKSQAGATGAEEEEGRRLEKKNSGSALSDSIILDENPNPCTMMSSQKGMFIRVLQSEGLLQVGNIDTNVDIFNVKLVLKNIKQLKTLLEKCDPQPHPDPELFINYILLGNNHSRKLDKKFNRTFKIQEKISINFRSSLKALHEYFTEIFYIPVELYLDSRMIGSVEIRLNKLIDTFELEEFTEKNPTSHELSEAIEINTAFPLDENEARPFIEYTAAIQYQASRRLHQIELVESYKMKSSAIDTKAGGDFVTEKADNDSSEIKEPATSKVEMVESKRLPTIEECQEEKHCDDEPKQAAEREEIPHLFCYTITIHSLKFNKKPNKGVWQVSFFHERANTPRTYVNREISEKEITQDEIIFEGLLLKLYFTAHVNEIDDVVAQPHGCTICVKGPYNTHVRADLNCNTLTALSKEQSMGNIVLTSPKNMETTAFAEVSITLIDEGVNLNSRSATRVCDEENVSQEKDLNDQYKTALFDENIAYNMILELEEWKNAEREKFLQDLKRAEHEHLQKIKEDFEQRTLNYEEQIAEKKNTLNELMDTIASAQKSFDVRSATERRQEREQFQHLRDELERTYQEKISMMRLDHSHTKQDLEQQLARKNIQIEELHDSNRMLQEKICKLHNESHSLKECIANLKMENESLTQSFVPKCELESLLCELKSLKETYDEVQQSKAFYKEQWAKMVREKSKQRQENANRVRDSIFEAKYDKLHEDLSDELTQVNFDKDELAEIKMYLSAT